MRKPTSAGRVRRRVGRLAGAMMLAMATVTVSAATAQAWTPQPEPESYGRSQPVAVSVTMNDGVVLAAQVIYPTNLGTTTRAPGTFPVLLAQNPYGTAITDPTTSGDYFVKRGYIYVVASIRGTATSGGQLDWFGQRQGQDGATLVNWAAHTLSGSNGNVGLEGCSFLGVDQWYTAAEVGPNSALKAIAPFCTDSEMYNDITASGGVPTAFIPALAQVIPRGPQDNAQTDPLSVTVNDLTSGGARSYNNEYWHGINVQELMPRIVGNGVPALSMAGWNDLFPAGNLGAYVAAQNAYFGRPLNSPIAAGAPVTGRYQAIVGPWTHSAHVTEEPLLNIRKEWYDAWLKGRPNGIADTNTPLHLFENGATRWVDGAAWPPALSTSTYYFNNPGTLTTAPPTTTGADTMYYAFPWFPLSYTTTPMTQATVLDGPVNVSVYLKSTTRDALVAATVNLVSPFGVATKITDGALLASMRELDTGQSWYGTGNTLIKPSHPFIQASQRLLAPNETVRLDISVLPNLTLIPAGYRLQVVLSPQAPSNFHLPLTPTPQQTANLNFGQSSVSRAPQAASSITLPLTSPNQFATSPVNWGPSS